MSGKNVTEHYIPQSALVRRLLRIAASFAIVVAAYCLYAVAAVPLIEPSAGPRHDGQPSRREGAGSLAGPRIEALRTLFADDSWELDNPKVLESDEVKLLMQDYRNLGDGRVEITPCTIILTPGKSDSDEAERLRRAVVLQAPEGALLEFDRPFNLRRADIGRLVAGQLRGKVTIRSRGQRPGEDDLHIATRDVQMNEREVATPHVVDFRWGPNFGRGRQMNIKLLPGDQAAHSSRRGPNIGGVELFEVRYVERLHLDLGKVRFSPDTPAGAGPSRGVAAAASGMSTGGQAASGTRPASGTRLPLEVTCNGPFRFDAIKQVATFTEKVHVWRVNSDDTKDQLNSTNDQLNGTNDQLTCDLLSIFFVERVKTLPGAQPATAAGSPGAPPGPTGLTPQRLEARGNPVIISAPSEHLNARGQRLEYDFQLNRVTLEAADEALLQQDANEIHARSLQYQSVGPGRLGLVVAEGPGWLRGQTAERPDQILEARWKGQLQVRPHAQNQLISLGGGAALNFPGFGQLDAREIYFWMLESPPAGKSDRPGPHARLQPDRMLAREEVHIDSPQLAAAVDRLEVWFDRTAAPAGGQRRAVERGAALRPTAYRVPNAGATEQAPSQPVSLGVTGAPLPSIGDCPNFRVSENGTVPFDATIAPAADPVAGAPPDGAAAPQAPARQQHFDVLGRLLRARVLVRENDQQSELCELMVEDRVRFVETQTTQPDERPLLITGDRLHAVDAGKPFAAVTVTGAPAHFEGRGLSLTGSNINLNRGTNRLWIDGAGRTELPLDRDLESLPLSAPGVLQVDWRERMMFDGRTAQFEGSVTASTPTQELRTETLEVQLQRPINFAEASARQDAQPEQILCRGGVLMESRGYSQQGQISHERVQVADMALNLVNGAFTAGGPGWVVSVRRGGNDPLSGDRLGGDPARNAMPSAAGQTPVPGAEQPDDQLKCLHVRFQGSVSGNLRRRWLTFHDHVHTAYAPVETWLATLPVDSPESLGPHGVVLHCDELSVHEMVAPVGNRRAMELEAKGNAIAEGTAFTARALRMTYTEAKDLLVLEGDGWTDARLFRQQQVGGATSQAAARKILYWPKTNKLWIDGARSLELSRSPARGAVKP